MNEELIAFYGWWQTIVCLFACLALLGIWWHIGRKQKDFGQVWLALSILCWSFSGMIEIYFSSIQSVENDFLIGWRSTFSLLNSLFILLALPWFRYIPKRIEPLVKSNLWIYLIGIPFVFAMLPTVTKMVSGQSIQLISELDVYYALLTVIFLGAVLWNSFARRRLTILAWLSVIVIIFTVVAQILKLTGSSIDMLLFSAIFKTCLIMIFFALALSWVKELTEQISRSEGRLVLSLRKVLDHQGRMTRTARIEGIQGQQAQDVMLSTAPFELLETFALKRKTGQEGWLEIKPKNSRRSGVIYDIRDHNEIKRLLESLLDGIYGKGNWTKELHYIPLKDMLFESSETRERNIRLRLGPKQIELNTSD